MRKEKERIIRTLDLLVIDEISMVRADLLDAVDTYLKHIRRNQQPFGGVQLLMIGDLQQLSPVVTEQERELIAANYSSPYFFASKALAQTQYITIELQKVYRQTDQQFIDLLNKVRNNCLTQQDVDRLNSRVLTGKLPTDGVIRLSTHNRTADAYNEERLGTVMEVLCEGFDSNEGCFAGRTYADSVDIDGRVLFTASGVIPAGEFVSVRITGVSDGDLIGEIEE